MAIIKEFLSRLHGSSAEKFQRNPAITISVPDEKIATASYEAKGMQAIIFTISPNPDIAILTKVYCIGNTRPNSPEWKEAGGFYGAKLLSELMK